MARVCLLVGAAAAAVGLCAGAATGQGFNIDLNATTGPGAGVPIITFGGAAGQTGVWSNVPVTGTGPFALANLNGTASGVTIEFGGTASGSFTFDNAASSGDHAALLEDGRDVPTGTFLTFTVHGLAAGAYEVYCYAIAPDSATARCTPTVLASGDTTSFGSPVGGVMPADSLVEGVTHNRSRVLILPGHDLLGSVVQQSPGSTFGSLSGMQIKPVPAGTRLYVGGLTIDPGYHTGADWAHAIPEPRDALTVAAGDTSVTEIWVKQGSYRPTAGTDRSASFVLRNNLAVYGSFAGTEAALAERVVPDTPTSELSGDIGDVGVADNSYNVVDARGVNATAALDGFSVRRGNTEGGPAARRYGGGLLATGGTPTLRRVKFQGNFAFAGGGAYFDGGSITLSDCQFVANHTYGSTALDRSNGAGMAMASGTLTMTNCVFDDNGGQCLGAGLYAAGTGGAITGCRFSNNSSADTIAAVELVGPSATVNGFTLVNCTITGNGTTAGFPGAALSLARGMHTVRNCIVWGNRTLAATVEGQQIDVSSSSALVISDTTVEGWTGTLGGGSAAFCDGTNPRLVSYANPKLRPGSPCIDHGWNVPLPAGYTTDLAGVARRLNDASTPDPSFNTPPSVDRGAYEFVGNSCIADVASLGGAPVPDGMITPDDLVVFLQAFFANDLFIADIARLGGTLGPDNAITADDLVVYLSLFFAGCS